MKDQSASSRSYATCLLAWIRMVFWRETPPHEWREVLPSRFHRIAFGWPGNAPKLAG